MLPVFHPDRPGPEQLLKAERRGEGGVEGALEGKNRLGPERYRRKEERKRE